MRLTGRCPIGAPVYVPVSSFPIPPSGCIPQESRNCWRNFEPKYLVSYRNLASKLATQSYLFLWSVVFGELLCCGGTRQSVGSWKVRQVGCLGFLTTNQSNVAAAGAILLWGIKACQMIKSGAPCEPGSEPTYWAPESKGRGAAGCDVP